MNGAGKNSLLLPLALSLVLSALSIYCHHGGVLHYEAERRLPYYLSDAPFLVKIYDSDYLDYGQYQARELSCVFDYLDCKFIAACVVFGHPHFLSLTHYVFLILIGLVLWRFSVGELGLEPSLAAGVLLLFWTTPYVFLGGVFFRSAKIGLSLVVMILYWRIFRLLRAARETPECKVPVRSWWFCFVLACAGELFDRQGVFMCGMAVIFLIFWFYKFRRKNALTLAGAFAAALAFSVIYNRILDPIISLSLEHYWPDFKYQHLPWAALGQKPGMFASSAADLYLDAVRFFLGNIPWWAALCVVLGLSWWALPEGLGLVVVQTALVWAMTILMILRHNALLWPDVRRGYYFLPVVSMFAMTLLLTLSRLKVRATIPQWLPALLLAAALAGNISALPRHETIVKTGSLAASYQSTPILLDALQNLQNSEYRIQPEIQTNRVFRFFHDDYFSKTGR